MRSAAYVVMAVIVLCVMPAATLFAGDKDAAKKAVVDVKITSDSMKMLNGGKEVIYSGNVFLDAGFDMCSGELRFFYIKAGEMSEIKASGGVMFVHGTRTAKAESARYDKAGRTIKLSGGAVASQCGTIVRGETITFDLDTDNVQVEGLGGKKVKMVVMPRKKSCQGKQSGEEIKCQSSR